MSVCAGVGLVQRLSTCMMSTQMRIMTLDMSFVGSLWGVQANLEPCNSNSVVSTAARHAVFMPVHYFNLPWQHPCTL
jgi:hypothetical protein